MSVIIAIFVAVVLFFLLKAFFFKSKQDAIREHIYSDENIEIRAMNGASNTINGEYWKAVFVMSKDVSRFGKSVKKSPKLLLRFGQHPREDAPTDARLGLNSLIYEITIPQFDIKRSFQELNYMEAFGPDKSSTSVGGAIEVKIDGDTYLVSDGIPAESAEQIKKIVSDWLTQNTLKFGWEGISSKDDFLTKASAVNPRAASENEA